jgi:cyclopropane-fatty-acyl-phospholipid synthase
MFERIVHRALSANVAAGTLCVTYPSGRREIYRGGPGRESAIRVADSGALRAIAVAPGLAVGEMYMEGRLEIERGNIADLLDISFASFRADTLTGVGRIGDAGRAVLGRLARGAGHAGIARRNVAHHYDLDERLTGSFSMRTCSIRAPGSSGPT